MNLENCVDIKEMTAKEAAHSLCVLLSRVRHPLGIGVWEGKLEGKLSGNNYTGEHVAVFSDDALVAPFGKRGDPESESCAAIFVIACKYAEKIADALGCEVNEPLKP